MYWCSYSYFCRKKISLFGYSNPEGKCPQTLYWLYVFFYSVIETMLNKARSWVKEQRIYYLIIKPVVKPLSANDYFHIRSHCIPPFTRYFHETKFLPPLQRFTTPDVVLSASLSSPDYPSHHAHWDCVHCSVAHHTSHTRPQTLRSGTCNCDTALAGHSPSGSCGLESHTRHISEHQVDSRRTNRLHRASAHYLLEAWCLFLAVVYGFPIHDYQASRAMCVVLGNYWILPLNCVLECYIYFENVLLLRMSQWPSWEETGTQ